jgi:transcriptional antiterminator NusG
MYKWYVVRVISNLEKKVKKALEENRESSQMTDLLEQVLVPSQNVAEVKRGEQQVSERRLWPGYILVKMQLTDETWMYVKNTHGVIEFLGGTKPQPLPDSEIEGLLQELEEKQKGVVQKHNIMPGHRVKITDGVFINFIGTVVEVFHEKGRLSALVSIFGRDTRVDDLEFWQVELVTEDQEES